MDKNNKCWNKSGISASRRGRIKVYQRLHTFKIAAPKYMGLALNTRCKAVQIS